MHHDRTNSRGRIRFADTGKGGRARGGSVIIHDFAYKSSFFMSLGACRLKKRILVLVVGLWASINFISCGSSGSKSPPSGLPNRVLASQSATSSFVFGELVIIDGENDTLPRISPLQAGTAPGLMAISPSRNLVGAFDSTGNTVYTVDTVTE